MDKKQEYELKEYEDDLVTSDAVMDAVVPSPQKPTVNLLVKLGVAVLVIHVATFILLLAVLAVQIAQSDTACTCNCAPSTSAPSGLTSSSSTSNDGPNCSIVYNDWTDDVQNRMTLLQSKVNKLVNTSESTAWKIDDIRSFADSQTETSINNARDIDKILETTGNSTQKLMNIVNTLSNHKDTSTSTAGVVDEILLVVQELLVLHNDTADLPTSCQQIKAQNPNSPSGVYLTVPAHGGSAAYTYCNMDTLCGSGGGWTRLAYLDMSDATQSCPSGFRLYQSGGVRACGRPSSNSPGCLSVQFPSHGTSYSQVCGRVVGYQYGSPDAVSINNTPGHNNINSYYVDGVSITRGSPRQHVWTFMAGFSDTASSVNNCPCTNPPGNLQQVQSFVGTNYFCESGNPSNSWTQSMYASDPLWDGQGCGSNEGTCCAASGLPWFHRDYGSATTTDYLELRICDDEGTNNEDIPVGYYEIYVK